MLTTDFGFREAVSSGDAPTLLSAVQNQRARIDADLLIVLTPDGQPLASSLGTLSVQTENDLKGLIAGDADAEILQLYRLIDGRPYQLVLAPVLAPQPIGRAAMGFALDDAVAGDMSRLLGVDVSFVAGEEPESPYIATSLGAGANLGHAMNLKVVAEGVEVSSSWDTLGRLGCDLIQGYFVSKPLSPREFTAWMQARAAPDRASSLAEGDLTSVGERLRASG